MRRSIKPAAAAVLLIGLTCLLCGQSAHKPLIPLAPAELIKLLPGVPADWKMTDSSAKSFFLGWVCSQATREFQHPAPVTQPGGTPAPAYVTRVRLMDTGYYPSFNGDFENFRVGKYSNA